MTAFRTLRNFKILFLTFLFLLPSCSQSPKELKEEAAKYFNQAVDYYSRGYYGNAKDLFIEVVEIEDELKLSDRSGDCFLYLGLIEYEFANYENALNYNNLAVKYFKQKFNRRSEGIALNNIGNIYSQLGHYDAAAAAYRKSLNVSQFSADKEGEAIAQLNIGSVYSERGDYQSAFDYFSRGFKQFEILGDLQGQAVSSNKIGEAYLRFGSLSDALNTFEFARETAENAGLKELIPSIMNNIAVSYFQMGDYNSAINALEYANAKLNQKEDPSTAWIIQNNFGDCYRMLFQYDNSIKSYNAAIAISDEYGEGLNSAFLKLKIAAIKLLQGKGGDIEALNEAEEMFSDLEDYFDEVQFMQGKMNALAGRALVYSYQKKNEDAYELMIEVQDMIKEHSFQISNQLTEYYCLSPEVASTLNLNIPFLKSKKYGELINFTAVVNERKKLNFLNSLNEFKFKTDSKNKAVDSLKELRAELNYLRFEIANEKGKSGGDRNSERLDNLIDRLDQLNLDNKNPFEDFINNEYNFVNSGVDQIKKRLKSNQLVMFYFSGDENITAIGLSQTKMFTETLDLFGESLSRQVNSLISNIERNDTVNTFALLNGIYNRLIAPLENKLTNVNEITFAPYFEDAALQYLPYHALITNSGEYLCEWKKVNHFSGLNQTKEKLRGGGKFIVADSFSENIGAEIIKPSHAAKETLLREDPSQLVLFVPVYFSMQQPTSSYIELSRDSVTLPGFNMSFGNLPALSTGSWIINNFFTDKQSSLKLLPQLIPSSSDIVISHYNIPEEYKKEASTVLLQGKGDYYKILDKKYLYWISYFHYLKLR
ncbi:MAG: hypothetical protein AUK34_04325 [Ignavibacteria bacterium CG2_30_36_16]|nr:MAG: hypothetical protein AUK34_04325 [Ignavibacteria bacterium CG2_30_36_16]